MERMKTLYSLDSKGKTRFWLMEIDGARYRTVSGIVGGKEMTTGWSTAEPKNVGRSNATTAEEQAIMEVEAQYTKKRDKKYYENQDEAAGYKFLAPMLAEKYAGHIPPGSHVQPKLDGYRAIATSAGLISRGGKPFRMDHIMEDLEYFFEKFPGVIFDGELYNHELKDDFDTLGSLIKKQDRTEEQEAKTREMVQYHIYDLPSHPGDFGERFGSIVSMFGARNFPSIRLVPTFFADAIDSDELYSEFIAQGYEGQMIRLPGTGYEFGRRSKSLLKRKEFMDAEFPLIAVEEGDGNWAGYAKRAKVLLPDGQTPGAGIKGNQAFTRQLLQDWRKYTHVTVRFFGYTPEGSLRFPVAVDWHEGERSY